MFMAGRRPAAAARVPLVRPRRHGLRAARRPRRAHGRSSSTAATSTARRSTAVKRDGSHILNVDHHHDNTRFGDVDLVVPEASCTAEIVWDLMPALGVEPTPAIAEALYVGLVTDTGQFMYENTGPRAHLMAADLIEAGVDTHDDLPPPLRGHAVRQARAAGPRAGARRALRRRPADDDRADARGLRRDRRRRQLLRGRHRPPARGRRARRSPRWSRELERRQRPQARSRCAPPTARSTSRRSPARPGGGGHRQAAGFTTEMADDEIVAFLRGADRRAARTARPRPAARRAWARRARSAPPQAPNSAPRTS